MKSLPFMIHSAFIVLSAQYRDGLISRDEITAYFMRASVICSKLGLGFSHNFQETTYMRPTFCDNCSGFVSHSDRLDNGAKIQHEMQKVFIFLLFCCSCGASLNKATDAEVFMRVDASCFLY